MTKKILIFLILYRFIRAHCCDFTLRFFTFLTNTLKKSTGDVPKMTISHCASP